MNAVNIDIITLEQKILQVGVDKNIGRVAFGRRKIRPK